MSAYRWTMEWARVVRIRTLGRLQSPSTNTEAKQQLDFLGHRSLVIADHQTAGRGRGDHTWNDEPGQALLSSWIFQAPKSPQPIMSALIGLTLFEAAVKTWPKIPWALKAPNDLHVVDVQGGAKKVAGMLIELLSSPEKVSIIIGLGLNVTGSPSGTKPYPATFLAAELSERGLVLTEADWGRFLLAWVTGCEARLGEGLVPELKQNACDALAHALARHPQYRDIQDVRADGSLNFKDGRTVSWAEL